MGTTKRRVLLVAFHYPPIQGSSGVHRSLAFSRYLPEFGWDVTALTVHERAHESTRAENAALIPSSVTVLRAQAWDAARHFALAGRYPSALALPDRWSSWVPFGVRAALAEHRRRPFDAIFSTFPIASAHRIGGALAARTGLPWVADFRDPMATPTYPHEPSLRRRWMDIQDATVRGAQRVTVTTPGAARFYGRTYPDLPGERFVVIENGYDPELFSAVDAEPAPPKPAPDAPLLLLHSGVLYPRERDPRPFFAAVRRLLDAGDVSPGSLEIRLRASGFDDEYRAMIAAAGLTGVVTLAPSLPYVEALREMRSADALLLFQSAFCNEQIPAKAYEYLYCSRPILGLTDPAGDTGRLLARFGTPGIAASESAEAIHAMLREALPAIRAGRYAVASRDAVASVSRRAGTQRLAGVLDASVAEAARRG